MSGRSCVEDLFLIRSAAISLDLIVNRVAAPYRLITLSPAIIRRRLYYSHSIVPGGLPVTS